jgi:hypothetical protein
MIQQMKSLHHPIPMEIGGEECQLLTVGYVAHVLHRTSWTIRHWTQLNLFPEAPFVLDPGTSRTRRRLYPSAFLEALGEITNRSYYGKRLDRDRWDRFHNDVFTAYEETVVPLLRQGVVAERRSPAIDDEGGQAKAS